MADFPAKSDKESERDLPRTTSAKQRIDALRSLASLNKANQALTGHRRGRLQQEQLRLGGAIRAIEEGHAPMDLRREARADVTAAAKAARGAGSPLGREEREQLYRDRLNELTRERHQKLLDRDRELTEVLDTSGRRGTKRRELLDSVSTLKDRRSSNAEGDKAASDIPRLVDALMALVAGLGGATAGVARAGG